MESTNEKSEMIIESLDIFKQQFGNYPKTLDELGRKLNKSIPKRTNIGTQYCYELNKEYGFGLGYQSYYGYSVSYNNLQKEWITQD